MNVSRKRTLCGLLAAAIGFAALTGCGDGGKSASQPADKDVKLWWAYNTENFMQDVKYDLDRDSTLRFSSLKGETESIQLMITPAKDVESFDFKMEAAAGPDGAVIAADRFEVLAEKYMETVITHEPEAYLGWYPDALIPLKNYQFRKENKIKAGQNQGIWFNLNVAEDTPAGKYTGKGTLTLDGKDYTIPVEIQIYDMTIPKETHAVAAYDIWWDQIAYGEGDNTNDEMYDTYYRFIADKRVTPQKVPSTRYANYTQYADYIVEFAEDPIISAYCLPYRKTSDSRLDEASVTELLNALIDKNIAMKKEGKDTNLFEKAYYYFGGICDEPTTDKYPIVRECDLFVTKAKFKLAERLNAYPDLKESLLNMRHVVTVTYSNELVGSDTEGGVQTWCPLIDKFNSETFRAEMKKRQDSKNTNRKYGVGVWWYSCIFPTSPFPTYHTDDKLISSRTMRWMQFDYGIEGFLFWNVNYYQKYAGAAKGPGPRDIWTDPNSWENCNGDGQLIYPGRQYGIKGPITTLRLESIRESQEDYEYLWMFEQKIGEYNKNNNKSLDANQLLQRYFTKLYQNVTTYTDSDVFAQTRTELLDTLQAMYADLDKAVENLQK